MQGRIIGLAAGGATIIFYALNVRWPLAVIIFAAGLVFSFSYHVYQTVLKEAGRDSTLLLNRLKKSGNLRQLYGRLLWRALNRLDRLLGDAGRAEMSLPSPFGNRRRWPYWTAISFDRCALIAMMSPLAAMLLLWICTGDTDDVGQALGLRRHVDDAGHWLDAIPLLLFGVAVFGWRRSNRAAGSRSILWRLGGCAAFAFACVFAFAFVIAGAFSGTLAVVFAFAGTLAFAGAGTGIGAFAVTFAVAFSVTFAAAIAFVVAFAVAVAGGFAGSFAGGFASGFAITVIGAVAGAFAVAGVAAGAVAVMAARAHNRRQLGRFWRRFWWLAMAAAYGGLIAASHADMLQDWIVLPVMLGIVPLLSIPFGWAAYGATRALLRRACESGAPSPFWLGLGNFGIGLVLLVLLAAALIAALQAVDAITLRWGQQVLIGVTARLRQIGEYPADTGNDWIYFTLFSPLIPSVVNLGIGAVSLVTYLSPQRLAWMIREIPCLGTSGTAGTRHRIVTTLAGFAAAGTFAAGMALWGVGEAVIRFAPWLLTGFLRAAQWWAGWLAPLG